MAESRCGHVLIAGGKRLRGILTGSDALVRVAVVGLDPAATRVGAVMARDVEAIAAGEVVRRMEG